LGAANTVMSDANLPGSSARAAMNAAMSFASAAVASGLASHDRAQRRVHARGLAARLLTGRA
jgi:hypothetical protein